MVKEDILNPSHSVSEISNVFRKFNCLDPGIDAAVVVLIHFLLAAMLSSSRDKLYFRGNHWDVKASEDLLLWSLNSVLPSLFAVSIFLNIVVLTMGLLRLVRVEVLHYKAALYLVDNNGDVKASRDVYSSYKKAAKEFLFWSAESVLRFLCVVALFVGVIDLVAANHGHVYSSYKKTVEFLWWSLDIVFFVLCGGALFLYVEGLVKANYGSFKASEGIYSSYKKDAKKLYLFVLLFLWVFVIVFLFLCVKHLVISNHGGVKASEYVYSSYQKAAKELYLSSLDSVSFVLYGVPFFLTVEVLVKPNYGDVTPSEDIFCFKKAAKELFLLSVDKLCPFVCVVFFFLCAKDLVKPNHGDVKASEDVYSSYQKAAKEFYLWSLQSVLPFLFVGAFFLCVEDLVTVNHGDVKASEDVYSSYKNAYKELLLWSLESVLPSLFWVALTISIVVIMVCDFREKRDCMAPNTSYCVVNHKHDKALEHLYSSYQKAAKELSWQSLQSVFRFIDVVLIFNRLLDIKRCSMLHSSLCGVAKRMISLSCGDHGGVTDLTPLPALIEECKKISLLLRCKHDDFVHVVPWQHFEHHTLNRVDNYLREVQSLLIQYDRKFTRNSGHLILISWEGHYLLSKFYGDGFEGGFWKSLESIKYAVNQLIITCAKPCHDYRWLFEREGFLVSKCRMHLAILSFPKAIDPDTELLEMLSFWVKLLDDSLFSELKNQHEDEFIKRFHSWLSLICQAIFNPENSLFVTSEGHPQEFYPNPELVMQPFHLDCFKFAGKIIALALLHEVDTGVVLHHSFLMNLVGKNLFIEDNKEELVPHHLVESNISRQVKFFWEGLLEIVGAPTVDILKSLEPQEFHSVLHERGRIKAKVGEFIMMHKRYDHKEMGIDRLIYRYKQIALPGFNITNWVTVERIGDGSFGTVLKAISDNGSIFAVKKVSLVNTKKGSVEQLEQEMNSLCQFNHPNIVKYLGFHKDDYTLCVFLELVGSGSLVNLFQKHTLKPSQISSYTKSILEGLKYLHDHNVVHRDIKSANILIANDGRVKLADFGLAKVIETHPGFKSYAGTMAWMAPEFFNQDFREGELIGIANDIWSLGCTVLEMFTRKPPYTKPGLTREKLRSKIARGELPPIPEDLPDNAKDFITSCLQVYPSKRPTAAQLLQHPFVNSGAPSDNHFFLEP